MSHVDPRLRQRVAAAPARPKARKNLKNAELVALFAETTKGNLAEKTIRSYSGAVLDAIAYFRTKTGKEIPVRKWKKTDVSAYLLHVKNNYCAEYRVIPYLKPPRVRCERNVWVGSIPAEEAAEVCAKCPLFRQPEIDHRLDGLGRFFAFLAALGYVPVNFMRDVRSEHSQSQPRHARKKKGEKKRNPTRAEEVRLVNGTVHPMRRFLYAASAKWGPRPNEAFLLDRYASFGEAMPEGCAVPLGFETGFPMHPDLKPFSQGGDMAYLPDPKGALDKRQGNRWFVVDPELRPLAEAALAWWDRTIRRDKDGRPKTTRLLITDRGFPLQQNDINALLYADCERLGLMQPGDRKKKLRRWSLGCQRHHHQRNAQELELPTDFNKQIRGDILHDARGEYFSPPPHFIREKWYKHVKPHGFTPLPDPRAAIAANPQAGASAAA